jgi:hypothetical protein
MEGIGIATFGSKRWLSICHKNAGQAQPLPNSSPAKRFCSLTYPPEKILHRRRQARAAGGGAACQRRDGRWTWPVGCTTGGGSIGWMCAAGRRWVRRDRGWCRRAEGGQVEHGGWKGRLGRKWAVGRHSWPWMRRKDEKEKSYS